MVVIAAVAMQALPGFAQSQKTVIGIARVLSATTMIVAGREIKLANIISAPPGTSCRWKNRNLDCGKLATAGLKNLVVASRVTCTPVLTGRYLCRTGGYDVAYGLVHSGWAVPATGAPQAYFAKAKAAEKRRVGFWGAVRDSGKSVAKSLNLH